ncbi:type II toxin-antitoxin system CcdA family antitoxin [Thauera sp. 2A1]|uniref:type II toxin-antitoxin system CcdA family antitoxin n=1 Tax=Thauera sp. 2A1 TaxID=2570191 RepID=UPI0012909220|nr:type II toxin-antitoxin system CcdA family antitoxin [Thauera sp. 2A1]KAI5915283.1 type II toxin-antitoxin system CcdA family antitoxin [Thauera sp. 2A1]MBS0553506.1 type II toxin-antitoxin system CcdA family antitoxin [Pseudomonadota bacterium]
MQTARPARALKRPVNLLLNEATVEQARHFTANLSATVDALLADYVARQIDAQRSRAQRSDAVAEAWNRFNAEHGGFADEHSTL